MDLSCIHLAVVVFTYKTENIILTGHYKKKKCPKKLPKWAHKLVRIVII